MKKNLTMTFTGDALFVADFPKSYDKDLKEISDVIKRVDVKITNLETNLSEFGDYANAYSGGTWLNTEPKDFKYLEKYGFNYYGTANNHVMDYSYHAMLDTIKELEKRGYAHSGTGYDLEDASRPAILNINGKKVGIIAVTTAFQEASKAGKPTPNIKGRPGVNYAGYDTYYQVDEKDIEDLKRIAAKTHINATREKNIKTGYVKPAPEGVFVLGTLNFCLEGTKPTTQCIKADKERIINDIKKAKQECDYVFLFVHCHTMKGDSQETVPDHLIELAKDCIDAGCAGILGGGTHQLRPLEIYKGKPIFYSLGDFIYQGMRVKMFPADFLNKWGCDEKATAWEGLMARSQGNKYGLQKLESSFLTILPIAEYDGDTMVSLKMYPISLGFTREGDLNGLPFIAKGDEAKKIFDIMDRLSRPYGTDLKLENDVIVLTMNK